MVKVGLRPIVRNINLPTVIKTSVLPGDYMESLFIATQVGEIFSIRAGNIKTFLDIRSRIIKLDGYDERGLLGLAFHPEFYANGLFYLHYSVAGTQGPGAGPDDFTPNPCDPNTLNLKWRNRETDFDHIDTVEEWIVQGNSLPQKRRTLLNLRRPFSNHNGVNSLNFSPETGKLVLTTGDGGSGFDPFNLAQADLEIAGKIIEIDISKYPSLLHPPIVTRFNELPIAIQESLTVMAKGVRNIPGISFQRFYHQYLKYVGNVGQELVESIFSFGQYQPLPVTQLVQAASVNTIFTQRDLTSVQAASANTNFTQQNLMPVQAASTSTNFTQHNLINLGWRGWEGDFPTPIVNSCNENSTLSEKTAAFYDEAVALSGNRLRPLTNYFHSDRRADKFGGTALTGVQAYSGTSIPALSGSVVFTDLARKGSEPQRGALAYTTVRPDGRPNDFSVIETNYDFGTQSAYYVSLGANLSQTNLFLGVYGSMRVSDYNKGTVFEIVP